MVALSLWQLPHQLRLNYNAGRLHITNTASLRSSVHFAKPSSALSSTALLLPSSGTHSGRGLALAMSRRSLDAGLQPVLDEPQFS